MKTINPQLFAVRGLRIDIVVRDRPRIWIGVQIVYLSFIMSHSYYMKGYCINRLGTVYAQFTETGFHCS
jgi:hypothetical protein